MEERQGGAKDSASRPVSKIFVSSSHAAVRTHHGDFRYEVPNNDMIHCGTPCFVGVSDLQIPNTGAGMANVSTANNKLYIAVAENGNSPRRCLITSSPSLSATGR